MAAIIASNTPDGQMGKMMALTLQQKIQDRNRGIYLVGTTPPRSGTDSEKLTTIANKLLSRLDSATYDGLIVYDIQDESSRNAKARPFPFKQTIDPRVYSKLLGQLSGVDVITYKSVAQRCADSFKQWLNETRTDFNLQNLVLVGSPSSAGEIKLGLSDACLTVKEASESVFLGGVTIAERHAKKGNECQRLLQKSAQGAEFFISQAVYDAQSTVDLLTSYAKACAEQNIEPQRVILTFAPCGCDKTLNFMDWLGISVPDDCKTRLNGAQNQLFESLRICQENLKFILSHCTDLNIPLGLNIESLTNRKAEIDASVRLFHLLKHTMEGHYALLAQKREEDSALPVEKFPLYQHTAAASGVSLR